MAKGKKFFIVGPGFIGWNVVDRLIQEPSGDLTGSTRGSRPAVTTIWRGVHHQRPHDLIFLAATAKHLRFVEAVLAGVAERAKQGKSVILTHNSGTSVLNDNANGELE
ncbi:uncharacterized protein A1O9_00250 [Exophiala aquamarina CBS 119918]|uniref:NAD-dependent epimerase/dehydratase domain-containing protein n=1 Tax=Exophiala aquamarina CBS 119918 TaxID=1182545 RepID=A0A072PSJ1_9EURO|nr:uncharacterized protein A1O9_00250 [Exophiala aquamarina CBS 119918]KEF62278.1 hypothetical protein A1O9_00250 [Exophiala aquamarina CBS 119918]